jgi:capsular polysaccharide biosynthesis protein
LRISRTPAILIELLWRALKLLARLGTSRVGPFALVEAKKIPASLRQQPLFLPPEKAIRASNTDVAFADKMDIYPGLGYVAMRDVLITSNRRITGVIEGDNFFVPQSVDSGPWKIRPGEPTVGGILRQDNFRLLVNVGEVSKRIPEGILVGTLSPHNWFHWTIDTLPSVYLTRYLPKEFDRFPLLIPEQAIIRSNWLEPLRLVHGNRDIVPLTDREYVKVAELVWMDSPTSPGPLPIVRKAAPHFRVHGSAMREYRGHILEQLGLPEIMKNPSRRIFLARKGGSNREYNQMELLEIAQEHGVEPVFLEEMTFRESVEIFTEAKLIIGPHGAGWANALYANRSSRALMWTWPESLKDNWFVNVAQISQIKMKTIFTDEGQENPYHLEPKKFRQELESLLEQS